MCSRVCVVRGQGKEMRGNGGWEKDGLGQKTYRLTNAKKPFFFFKLVFDFYSSYASLPREGSRSALEVKYNLAGFVKKIQWAEPETRSISAEVMLSLIPTSHIPKQAWCRFPSTVDRK